MSMFCGFMSGKGVATPQSSVRYTGDNSAWLPSADTSASASGSGGLVLDTSGHLGWSVGSGVGSVTPCIDLATGNIDVGTGVKF